MKRLPNCSIRLFDRVYITGSGGKNNLKYLYSRHRYSLALSDQIRVLVLILISEMFYVNPSQLPLQNHRLCLSLMPFY